MSVYTEKRTSTHTDRRHSLLAYKYSFLALTLALPRPPFSMSLRLTLLAPMAFFMLLVAISALKCVVCEAAAQTHRANRMVLLGEDQQPPLLFMLGPNGWVQQQSTMLFDGATAQRNRFPSQLGRGTRGNRGPEEGGTGNGKVEKKWSRFEPSIRFF